MNYQSYRLCYGCRTTYTNQGQEINGIFYCDSCATIRDNNRQLIVRRAENIPSSVVTSFSNPQLSANNTRSIENISHNSNSLSTILPSVWEKYPIITVVAIIILLFTIIVIVINKTGKTQDSKNQEIELIQKREKVVRESQTKQTNKDYSNEIINEKFTISKYISTAGLNARSGPGTDFSSLFVIPQNALVYVSDSSRTKGWVKIKYDEKLGWVNGTFLRDFKINNIQIGNHDDNGYWIIRPGNNVYASQMEHLGIKLTFVTLNEYSKDTKLLLKIITPDNTYIQGSNIPLGFSEQWNIKQLQSGTYSYGTFNIPAYHYRYSPGLWVIELYYENPNNPSNTLACIATKQFTLY